MKSSNLEVGLLQVGILHFLSESKTNHSDLVSKIEELGYELNAGKLDSLLYGLRRSGYLNVDIERVGQNKTKSFYVTSEKGIEFLNASKSRIRELLKELWEEELEY